MLIKHDIFDIFSRILNLSKGKVELDGKVVYLFQIIVKNIKNQTDSNQIYCLKGFKKFSDKFDYFLNHKHLSLQYMSVWKIFLSQNQSGDFLVTVKKFIEKIILKDFLDDENYNKA